MWKQFFYEICSDYDKELWEISLQICSIFWAFMKPYETLNRVFIISF